MEESRIYVAVAGTVQAPPRHIIQPPGRQIAQAAHVVSKLRWAEAVNLTLPIAPSSQPLFYPITTIILQARDSAELNHIILLLGKERLVFYTFDDTNPEYGSGSVITAVAVRASKEQIAGILDYLPLWNGK